MGALTTDLCNLLSRHNACLLTQLLIILTTPMGKSLVIGKIYQCWDYDPERGAIATEQGVFSDSYPTPVYLGQGWSANDSFWYYNTTQGSALMPIAGSNP